MIDPNISDAENCFWPIIYKFTPKIKILPDFTICGKKTKIVKSLPKKYIGRLEMLVKLENFDFSGFSVKTIILAV